MPSNAAARAGADTLSRRTVLAAAGTGIAASVAGCSEVLPGRGREGDTDPAEVVVENATADHVEIAVRIVDDADEPLFSRVFSLGPETIRSRGSIARIPTTIHAFTPSGLASRWRYDPDLSPDFDCEIKDVGLTLDSEDAIEPWYSC